MTALEFFGCVFIAFGPPFSLFCFTIASDPVKIIILIASAFFWLLSLLLSSILWSVAWSLVDDHLIVVIIFSVIFQECGRFIVYLLLRKAEVGLNKVTDSSAKLLDNKHILAYVTGLGFGMMSGAFALINVLADAVGPGTVGLLTGNERSTFFVASSLTTLCFILLHVAWSVMFFHALDNKSYIYLAIVLVTHTGASAMTLLNSHNVYFASIIPEYVILIFCTVVAFHVAGGKISKEILSRKPPTVVSVPVPDSQ